MLVGAALWHQHAEPQATFVASCRTGETNTLIRLCCCAATNTASRASSMPPFVCPVGGSCGEGSGGEDDGSDGGSGNGSSVDTTCVRGRCVVVVS